MSHVAEVHKSDL